MRAGLVLSFFMTLVAACGGTSSPAPASPALVTPSASGAATPRPSPVALKMAIPTMSADFLWVYIAKDAGIFADNGIDADVQYIASTQSMAALLAGQVDISLGGGSDALAAAASGADLVTVAVPSPTYPFIFEAAPGINSVADLKGKKVGVSSFGSSSDIATRVALRKLGLDPDKDVSIVLVGSAQERTAAAIAGAIQGAVSLVPDNLVLEEKGWKPLFNLIDLKLPAVQNAVIFDRKLLTTRRDVAQRFIDAMVIAIAREKKDRPLAIEAIKKWSKITDQKQLDATYDLYSQVHPSLPYPRVEMFNDAKDLLGAKNDKIKTFDVAKILDDSLVKSAADRGLDKR